MDKFFLNVIFHGSYFLFFFLFLKSMINLYDGNFHR